MYSKAKIAGHPIHPMLVAFPIAFYASACVAYMFYAATGIPFWFQVAFLANIAGVLTALVAAVPGFIDWAFGVPKRTPAKTTGFIHMTFNVTALVLFAACAWTNRDAFETATPSVGWAIVLSLFGMAFSLAGGYLGWKMVATHHVGVELTPEQEKIDRARGRSQLQSVDTEGSRRVKPIDTAM